MDKNTTTTVSRYVNELVSPRTMVNLTEKKSQVTGNYLCTENIHWGVQNCIFASVQWRNKKLRPVI